MTRLFTAVFAVTLSASASCAPAAAPSALDAGAEPDAADDDPSAAPPEGPLFKRLGGHAVAAIIVNFSDVEESIAPDALRRKLFTGASSANAWFKEVSYGQFWLEGVLDPRGDVFEVTLPFESKPCAFDDWGEAARAAAADQGLVVEGYDFVFYFFAGECKSQGRPDWSPPSAWIDNASVRAIAHEGGHAIGWSHASAFECSDGTGRATLSGDCTIVEYGDPYDVMGGTGSYQANQHKRGQLGWMPQASTTTVTRAGSYAIAPIERAADGAQSLRIPRIVGSDGVEEYLYLEARQPYGFDDFSASSPAARGVILRLAPPYDREGRSLLLDTTPQTEELQDAPLPVAATFVDEATGISVTTRSMDENGAVLDIEVGAPLTCIRGAPGGGFEPEDVVVGAGEVLELSLIVRNQDVDCPISTMSGSYALPDGWWSEVSAFEAPLMPGAEAERTISIAVPPQAPPGDYAIVAAVASPAGLVETFQATAHVE